MRLLLLLNAALAEDGALLPIDVDADSYVGGAVQEVLKKQAPLLDLWAREQAAEELARSKVPPFDKVKPLVSKAIDKLKPVVRDLVKSLPAPSQKAGFVQRSPRLGQKVPHRLPLPPSSKRPAQSGSQTSQAITNFKNVLAAVPHRLPLPPTPSNHVRASRSGFQAFEDFTFSIPKFDDVPELDDGSEAPHRFPIPPTPSKHTEHARRVTIPAHSAPQRPPEEAGSPPQESQEEEEEEEEADLIPPRQVTQDEEADLTPPRQVTQDEEADLTPPRQVTQEEEADLTHPRQVTEDKEAPRQITPLPDQTGNPTEKTLPRKVHKSTAPWSVRPKAQSGTDNGSAVFSLSCTLAMLSLLLV